jgi:hypothetical protein
METYRHTQTSRGILVIFGLMIVYVLVMAALLPQWPVRLILGALLVVFVGIGYVFSSLTTVLTEEHFVFYFGRRLLRKEIPLADIRRATPVRNSLIWGLGIHLTPHGWLYNVWGLDAVEIERSNGKKLRVGTDEPQRLASAIDERIAHRHEGR